MPKLDNQTILLALVVVTGLAVLLQAIVLLAIFLAMRKAVAYFREETENLRSSIMPVIYDTRDMLASTQGTMTNVQAFLADAQAFLTRVSPKVESVATDLVEITNTLRTQSVEMQSSAMEMMERVHRQSDRVDGMITEFLNTVDRAGGFVAEAVSKPVQQISSILRSAKAVVESLRGPRTLRQPAQPFTSNNGRF
jgi:methyl-accepting chemotaxis protein